MEGPVLTSDICVFLTFYFIACKANELVTCSSSRACLSLRERLAITTDRQTMQTNGACICLKAKDDYNQMLKATPDLLTFLI